jgi:hypothetical protein
LIADVLVKVERLLDFFLKPEQPYPIAHNDLNEVEGLPEITEKSLIAKSKFKKATRQIAT